MLHNRDSVPLDNRKCNTLLNCDDFKHRVCRNASRALKTCSHMHRIIGWGGILHFSPRCFVHSALRGIFQMWTRWYIYFYSFVPLQMKRNRICCLMVRARKISADDTIENKLCFLLSLFSQYGYPESFINNAMKKDDVRCQETRPIKKPEYVRSKSETEVEIIQRNCQLQSAEYSLPRS